jgi:hypothetical protein
MLLLWKCSIGAEYYDRLAAAELANEHSDLINGEFSPSSPDETPPRSDCFSKLLLRKVEGGPAQSELSGQGVRNHAFAWDDDGAQGAQVQAMQDLEAAADGPHAELRYGAAFLTAFARLCRDGGGENSASSHEPSSPLCLHETLRARALPPA